MENKGYIMHIFNPSTQEANKGGSLWVQDYVGLRQENLFLNQNKTQTQKESLQQQKTKLQTAKPFLSLLIGDGIAP